MSDELNLENLDAALENVDAAADEAPVADAPAEAVESAEPVAEAPVASPETVGESAEEESEVNESEQAEETDAGQKAVDEFSKSLRTLDGKWYVLHTYSGYEKRGHHPRACSWLRADSYVAGRERSPCRA